ncbi:OLC1v1000507C1 [Oldenlandia corymbosa var. corymbosa]|uniref:RING-type E3 ubiquitin transferase n=1 Tax=Oldenlandia corymbosa var. corymbosa TaxID=529605 RepID=A0AAV1D331_OLDCO|nr:OLC1v1000507C1 [Oldenlandia corymbosa var. corymbosa]
MGQILSKRHHNHHHNHHHHHHHQQNNHHQQLNNPQPPTPPPPSTPLPLPAPRQQAPLPNPAPPPPPPQPPVPTTFTFAANAPYPSLPPPTPTPPPPPPPPQPQSFPYYPQYNYSYSNYVRPGNVMGAQPGNYYNPYFVGHGHGNMWDRPPAGIQLPLMPPPPQPVPYVDHQSAKKIKNDVNVHKDTIKLDVDEGNSDCHLVSFTFDALVDGSITIYYYAKEGTKCTFTPVYPEMYVPVKIPFQKGLGQKFCQPSGSGIDLGFFDIDDLSKPSDGDVFPLVISAESSPLSTLTEGQPGAEAENASPHAQITQAVIEKSQDNGFKVKVIKQILWIDEVRYELREIFGISDPDEVTINDKDSGKECVICMTDPKDTAVLPCRHMCMCSECAKELRMQSNKCPICRQPIEELLEIKVDEGVS